MAKTYKPIPQQTEPTAPDDADLEEIEDTRDVWDKALDYAPTIGMFAGAVAGGRYGSKGAQKLAKQLESKRSALRKHQHGLGKGSSTLQDMKAGHLEQEIAHLEERQLWSRAGRTAQSGLGAIAGRIMGSATQDVFQKHQRKMKKDD